MKRRRGTGASEISLRIVGIMDAGVLGNGVVIGFGHISVHQDFHHVGQLFLCGCVGHGGRGEIARRSGSV